MINKYKYKDFEEIYNRQSDRIFKMCMTYLCNEEDAKEAVQNIFMKLLEKNIRFKDSNHENAWLCKATRNYCLDVLKSAWKKKRVDFETLPEVNTSDKDLENNEKELIEKALIKLSIKQKEVIYLYYYEEYSIKEISKILKRSESTIQTQLSTARKKMKEILNSEKFRKEED
ncbi:MAG: sigma-70 family RNA polymerase sigma factor [Lachnospiraceae bacterium]|nr:sigma-70 family RNA polymerase sigma factor [Lachnospiraceae bacterium]